MQAKPDESRVPERIRLWSLREDVLLEASRPDGMVLLLTRWGEVRIEDPGTTVRGALRRMTLGPVSLENVFTPSLEIRKLHNNGEPDSECVRLERVVQRLSGSIVHSLALDDGEAPLLSAVPVAAQADLEPPEVAVDRPIRLSRFAALRTGEGGLVVESPLSRYRMVLHRQPAPTVVAALGTVTTVAEVAAAVRLPEPVVADLVGFLVAGGMAVLAEPGDEGVRATRPRFAEDEDPGLLAWSRQDLMFHAHSRMGYQDGPLGAVFANADKLDPEPAVKKVPDGPRFALYRPSLTERADEPSLTEVLEGGTAPGRGGADRPPPG